MATQPDAQATINHLHTAVLQHRRASGIALTEEQRLQLERARNEAEMAALARGERPQ